MANKIFTYLRDGTFKHRFVNNLLQERRLFYLENDGIKDLQRSYIIYERLKDEYKDVELDDKVNIKRKKNKTIWVAWFQGIENAPLLCQTCVERIYKVFGKNNVVLLDKDNFKDYIDIPEYIVDKWNKGIISNAHFSDILRCALLAEKGGTWIDATILILKDELPKYFYDSELFMFADHVANEIPNIQSSYISAYSGSKILLLTQKYLYTYWQKENYLLNYSLFHLFFQLAEERYPDEWNKVYKYPNHSTHILRKSILKPFDKKEYKHIKDVCPIQKLTYKKDYTNIKNTFYEKLIVQKKI